MMVPTKAVAIRTIPGDSGLLGTPNTIAVLFTDTYFKKIYLKQMLFIYRKPFKIAAGFWCVNIHKSRTKDSVIALIKKLNYTLMIMSFFQLNLTYPIHFKPELQGYYIFKFIIFLKFKKNIFQKLQK
ncbi:hypothetical protein BpHYR1_004465 [Brachionus plicatilis]|uniref:Uncharacterized protein n=1 Tax=Brachionus plicatilis TaxID=10195 RepID=A0A3M7S9X3_BRAPC|nr:hypothetical protein BpHYR1_004465 [Brachionus plicatilis]